MFSRNLPLNNFAINMQTSVKKKTLMFSAELIAVVKKKLNVVIVRYSNYMSLVFSTSAVAVPINLHVILLSLRYSF